MQVSSALHIFGLRPQQWERLKLNHSAVRLLVIYAEDTKWFQTELETVRRCDRLATCERQRVTACERRQEQRGRDWGMTASKSRRAWAWVRAIKNQQSLPCIWYPPLPDSCFIPVQVLNYYIRQQIIYQTEMRVIHQWVGQCITITITSRKFPDCLMTSAPV